MTTYHVMLTLNLSNDQEAYHTRWYPNLDSFMSALREELIHSTDATSFVVTIVPQAEEGNR